MKDKKMPQKQDWFIEWSKNEDAFHHKNGRNKGVAASRITTTESYIKHNGFGSPVIDDVDEAGKKYLIKKFPYFQEAQGDGFCVLHASIVGILAKCVDNKKRFDEFKENLGNWGEDNELRPPHKERFDRVLRKLDQKHNITYQDFYNLVNEKGDDNISTVLSQTLLKCSDFDDGKKRQEFAKYFGERYKVDGGEARIQDEQWTFLKDQQRKKAKDVEFIDDIGAMYMLHDISPFEIEVVTGYNLRSVSTNKDTVYLSHSDEHFNLLHSSEDKNLVKAIRNLSSEVAIEEKKEALKPKKVMVKQHENIVSPRKKDDIPVRNNKKNVSFKEKEETVPVKSHKKLSTKDKEEKIQAIFIKSISKIEGTNLAKEAWNKLDLVEKKVMVHCYNQSHPDDKIKLSSLYKKSDSSKNFDIKTNNSYFVFRPEKENEVEKILINALMSVPKTEVRVHTKQKLNQISKVQEIEGY
ncbi:MAG: hypothetical protein KGQ36_06630 [Rickettsiales bacterium]|nr:hypothetical protein [Rickettsiales bacterium]